ncbi:hypothetical protein Q4I30_008099 [Leishmania utingensis]|uniref:Uncharacterized protein n=1 Tax=Leishmania utingensis TaxID=653362 RepID=A0AAW2ZVY1_9TRYP
MSRPRESSQKPACYGCMTLPNIPRIAADERSRQKYLSEYEKYEPELRRHHLGAADTTSMLGLKDVPADFDRTVPSLLGPTEAELEYERACESRKAQAMRKGRRGVSAWATQAATTDVLTPAAGKSISPQPPLFVSADKEPQQRGTPSASCSSSAADTPTTTAAAPAALAAGEEAMQLTPVEAAGTRTRTAEATEAAPGHIPPPSSAGPRQKPAPPPTSMSQPRARTAPSLKPPPTATRLGQHNSSSSVTSAQAVRPKLGQRSQPVRGILPATVPTTPRRPCAPFAAHEASTAESTARLLRVLLDPPQQYASSLHLNLSFFDLGWLRNGKAVPHRLTTIASYFSDNGASPQLRINSPRSVLTLLENGVSPKDWDPRSDTAFAFTLGETPQDMAAVQAEVLEHRRAYVQEQRDALHRTLQDSYSLLCARAPFNELVGSYRRLCEADMFESAALEEKEMSLATAVLQRQEQQRRVFETSRARMMRQVQQAKELQERQDSAVQRKLQAEAEAEGERRRKAMEMQARHRIQQARLEAHHAERQRREEAYKQLLQARLNKAATCNAERMAARERQRQTMQQRREAQEAERSRRLVRNAAILEEQAAVQEQKRQEKEASLEKLRATREARLGEEHRVLVEKQQRAAYLREDAKQRAAEAEEAVRQAALQRQLQAEERQRAFQARRQEEAAQRAAALATHHERLNEIRTQALAKEELFKATVEEKHRQHEDHHRDTRARQLVNIMWRREADWEREEAKAYAVLQLQRIAEFNKLHTVVDLLEKRKAANTIVRQRELIYEESIRARDKLRAEQDALKQRITSLPQQMWR